MTGTLHSSTRAGIGIAAVGFTLVLLLVALMSTGATAAPDSSPDFNATSTVDANETIVVDATTNETLNVTISALSGGNATVLVDTVLTNTSDAGWNVSVPGDYRVMVWGNFTDVNVTTPEDANASIASSGGGGMLAGGLPMRELVVLLAVLSLAGGVVAYDRWY